MRLPASGRNPSRRHLLALAAAIAAPPVQGLAAPPRRLAIIDWAALETALALGLTPVAAAELIQYRKTVIEPEVPDATADLGLRGAPSFERLLALAPDLIVSSNFYESFRPAFERVAPVLSLPVHMTGAPPLAEAERACRRLGAETGRADTAERMVADAGAMLSGLAAALPAVVRTRPVVLANLGDARHFRAFGDDSLFGNVLDRLGVANAWAGETRYSATAPIAIEALARMPEAVLALIEPTPPDARRALAASALWQALPMVRRGHVIAIGSVNHFGALPAALRFARAFVAGARLLP